MPRAVTIESVGQAFEVVKAMQADGLGFGDDHRPLARAALAQILEERMEVAVERHLDDLAALGEADRRNGSYGRRLLTGSARSSSRCRVRAASAPARCCAPMPGASPRSTA
jgi:hypothetical protein